MIMFICFFIINIMDNSLWDTLHEDLQKKIIKIRDDELEYDTKLLKLSNDFVRQYKKTNRFWIYKHDDYENIYSSSFRIKSNELIPE